MDRLPLYQMPILKTTQLVSEGLKCYRVEDSQESKYTKGDLVTGIPLTYFENKSRLETSNLNLLDAVPPIFKSVLLPYKGKMGLTVMCARTETRDIDSPTPGTGTDGNAPTYDSHTYSVSIYSYVFFGLDELSKEQKAAFNAKNKLRKIKQLETMIKENDKGAKELLKQKRVLEKKLGI